MKKKNKENKKQFVKICIFVILFIFLIPFIINLIVETPNPFGLGFINDSNKDTWISFFGSIIGGSITLIGVIWTINYEKKAREEDFKTQEERRQEDFNNQEAQRKKDLAIQYKPFFHPIIPMEIEGNSFEENAFPNNFTEHSFEINYTKDIIVKIKNSGRGEAIINNIIFDSPLSKTNKISVQHNNNLNDCIFPEQFFELSLHIIINDYDCLSSLESYYDFPITIEYTDFLKQNSYRKKICVLIKNASFDKENNQSTSTKFVVFIQEPLINEDEEEW